MAFNKAKRVKHQLLSIKDLIEEIGEGHEKLDKFDKLFLSSKLDADEKTLLKAVLAISKPIRQEDKVIFDDNQQEVKSFLWGAFKKVKGPRCKIVVSEP